MTKEEEKAYKHQWYLKNKERLKPLRKEYRKEHSEEIKHYMKEYKSIYNTENSELIKEKQKKYYKTPKGRAIGLLCNYNAKDKKYNRGECTLTTEWIIDNIFSSKCVYCGEDDWRELGCDRIDNDKPHTPDNVVPCCYSCNCKKGTMSYEEFKKGLPK